jgi:hypothetical protein
MQQVPQTTLDSEEQHPVAADEGVAPAVGRLSERDRKRFVFRAGRRKWPEAPRPEFCLNCGLHVPEHFTYCGGCGQENTPSAVSFVTLVQEACEEFVKIDSKLVKTLVPLLFKPGLLTQEYVAGRRLRYLSPFKMYAVVSAMFFVVFGVFLPNDSVNTGDGNGKKPSTTVVRTEDGKKRTQVTRVSSGDGDRLFKGKINAMGMSIDADALPRSLGAYQQQQNALPFGARDHGIRRLFIEKIIRINDNPDDVARDFLAGMLPLMMLFQLPALALLMKLFYLRSRRLYVEHLVFALHTHTFLFLILSPLLLSEILSHYVAVPRGALLDKSPLLVIALLGTLVVYHVVALRRVYRQSMAKTLFKGFLLANGYNVLLGFSAGFAVVLTLLWKLVMP